MRRPMMVGPPQIIELSPEAYNEIWNELIEAGYDWLVFPDMGQICMDGFVVRNVKRGQSR